MKQRKSSMANDNGMRDVKVPMSRPMREAVKQRAAVVGQSRSALIRGFVAEQLKQEIAEAAKKEKGPK